MKKKCIVCKKEKLSKEFSIHGTGFNIISQDLNLLEIVITEQIFNLVVSGFTDDKLVVKVRHDEN